MKMSSDELRSMREMSRMQAARTAETPKLTMEMTAILRRSNNWRLRTIGIGSKRMYMFWTMFCTSVSAPSHRKLQADSIPKLTEP